MVDDLVEQNEDLTHDEMNEILDEMIEDGPLRSQEVGGTEYVQLISRGAGLKALMKYRTKMAQSKMKRGFRNLTGGGPDE